MAGGKPKGLVRCELSVLELMAKLPLYVQCRDRVGWLVFNSDALEVSMGFRNLKALL